jgi:lipopolysaccharide export system protein LptA
MNKVLIKMVVLSAFAAMAANPALAQLSNKGGGILINSDKLEAIDAKNQAIFTGSVDAVQDDARLRADKLDVLFEAPSGDGNDGGRDVKTIIATGNVYYVTPKQIAKSEKAVYDVANDEVVMTGNVVVTQGKNVIRGDRLVLKISSGRAVFDAKQQDSKNTGRVRAAFFPAKKKEDTDGETKQ